MEVPFANRSEAGKKLGVKLAARYADRQDVLVLALPRGGVPVAYEVALAPFIGCTVFCTSSAASLSLCYGSIPQEPLGARLPPLAKS
jgi:hypothetical protein